MERRAGNLDWNLKTFMAFRSSVANPVMRLRGGG
jgi:hypothetical protein